MSDEEIGEFLQGVQRASLIVSLGAGQPSRVVPNDEDDDWVLATAIAGQADVICTRDADLFHANVLAYCGGHGMEVMDDITLLGRLRAAAPQGE